MFTLIQLPYAMEALEPVISAETISFHHGKHLQVWGVLLGKEPKGNVHFSGAEKRNQRDLTQGDPCRVFSFSLAQRKEVKETSTLTKASPYMERMQLKNAETDIFKTSLR